MRHARDDAEVRLLPDLLQRGEEQIDGATGEDLRRLHQRVGPERRLVDVTTDVRVKDEREDSRLGHREDVDGKKKCDC